MFFVWAGVFCISLFVLIKAADYFTEAAEKIGLAFKLSPFVLGVTIVSVGTAMPELATSVMAVIKGQMFMPPATALGSNIANILLVVGIAALVAGRLTVKRNLLNIDLPLLAATTVLILAVVWDKAVNFGEAVVLILAYVVYAAYILKSRRPDKLEPEGIWPGQEISATREQRFYFIKKGRPLNLSLVIVLVFSVIAIYFGADWCVRSVINLAAVLQIKSSVVVLLALAVGTSLPELAVAVTSVKKGKFEIALGNVFGANVFNSLMVMGVPALFGRVAVDTLTFSVGVPFLVGATCLYFFGSFDKKITRAEGIMYLTVYGLFAGKVIGVFLA